MADTDTLNDEPVSDRERKEIETLETVRGLLHHSAKLAKPYIPRLERQMMLEISEIDERLVRLGARRW